MAPRMAAGSVLNSSRGPSSSWSSRPPRQTQHHLRHASLTSHITHGTIYVMHHTWHHLRHTSPLTSCTTHGTTYTSYITYSTTYITHGTTYVTLTHGATYVIQHTRHNLRQTSHGITYITRHARHHALTSCTTHGITFTSLIHKKRLGPGCMENVNMV